MTTSPPSLANIIQATSVAQFGYQTVVTALELDVFSHLDRGVCTPDHLANVAGLDPRGALALLEALSATGLVTLNDGQYRNTEESSYYLVKGKPTSAIGIILWLQGQWGRSFSQLTDAVRTGTPPSYDVNQDAGWADMVDDLWPMSEPDATDAARLLDFGSWPKPEILDVGGGAGVHSSVLLRCNPDARSLQVDYPAINAIARRRLDEMGLADRFSTADGDLRSVDFGREQYDLAVYGMVAQLKGRDENLATLSRIREALRPGGRISMTTFVLTDDRQGPTPMTLFMNAFLLTATTDGGARTESTYRSWLSEAGFEDIQFHYNQNRLATILLARRP